jgi:hypothetical protein
MELERLLTCSQELATCRYSGLEQLVKPSPRPHSYFFKFSFNIILLSTPKAFHSVFP